MQTVVLPKQNSDYAFTTSIPVRVTDLVGGMHVANHNLVGYLTEAQMQMMKTMGFPNLTIGSAMPINVHLEISYMAEAVYGDVLDIGVRIEEFATNTYQLGFNVVNSANARVICQSRWLMSFIDMANHKRCDVPQVFIDAYKGLLA